MGKFAIFIFTNDNSTILKGLIRNIISLKNEINIHIIDDSSHLKEKHLNKIVAREINENAYLGSEEFELFYPQNERSKEKLMSIGNSKWNLGTARNFAVDYSKSNDYDKVLFVDQDIININISELKKGFEILDNDKFISFILEGLTDDSIIGHLATKYGLQNDTETLLSGGFFYFNPYALTNRFLNIYNEDWILQLLESDKQRVLLPYKVKHLGDLKNIISLEELIFQEIGELVIDGLLEDIDCLNRGMDFWIKIISDRKLYIRGLREIINEYGNNYVGNILSLLLDNYQIVYENLNMQIKNK